MTSYRPIHDAVYLVIYVATEVFMFPKPSITGAHEIRGFLPDEAATRRILIQERCRGARPK